MLTVVFWMLKITFKSWTYSTVHSNFRPIAMNECDR